MDWGRRRYRWRQLGNSDKLTPIKNYCSQALNLEEFTMFLWAGLRYVCVFWRYVRLRE